MKPWLDDGDVRLYHGNATSVLGAMPDESVHCIVTSPPYWGLRDYGVAGQIGLEASPDEFVDALLDVFGEARRVLRSDGTLWLNLGDSYAGSGPNTNAGFNQRYGHATGSAKQEQASSTKLSVVPAGLKPKDLVGQPWRVAFALQAAGWWLRSCIIWNKPNPMPESVTDRPTTAHEYIFLLTKSARYFYDADAVREDAKDWAIGGPGIGIATTEHYGAGNGGNAGLAGLAAKYREGGHAGRNMRSVWTIPTEPTPEAHFATYPQALVERCIRAGTSEHGCCATCHAPWRRVTEVERSERETAGTRRGGRGSKRADTPGSATSETSVFRTNMLPTSRTVGWERSCSCTGRVVTRRLRGHESTWRAAGPGVVPAVVLDPFAGSGTTSLVARRLGRHSIGIDLNADYLRIAAKRIGQPTLFSNPAPLEKEEES